MYLVVLINRGGERESAAAVRLITLHCKRRVLLALFLVSSSLPLEIAARVQFALQHTLDARVQTI